MSKDKNNENKDLTATFGNTMLAVVCFIFGHRYKVTKRVTKSIAELQCKRCKKEFGINTNCESLLPLDKELKELHKLFQFSSNSKICATLKTHIVD